MWRTFGVGTSGWSKQYFTRTAVVPAGTSNGTSTKPPCRLDSKLPVVSWSIRIGLPLRYRLLESMARPQVERAALLDVEALRRRLEAQARD